MKVEIKRIFILAMLALSADILRAEDLSLAPPTEEATGIPTPPPKSLGTLPNIPLPKIEEPPAEAKAPDANTAAPAADAITAAPAADARSVAGEAPAATTATAPAAPLAPGAPPTPPAAAPPQAATVFFDPKRPPPRTTQDRVQVSTELGSELTPEPSRGIAGTGPTLGPPPLFENVPVAAEVAVILSGNNFYPQRVRIKQGTETKLLFTTTNNQTAALIIENTDIQKWVRGASDQTTFAQAYFKNDIEHELSAERVTEVKLKPIDGGYRFHDAITGARGEIIVVEE